MGRWVLTLGMKRFKEGVGKEKDGFWGSFGRVQGCFQIDFQEFLRVWFLLVFDRMFCSVLLLLSNAGLVREVRKARRQSICWFWACAVVLLCSVVRF